MVWHNDIAEALRLFGSAGFPQQLEIEHIVCISAESFLPRVTSLGDEVRVAWYNDTGKTRHGTG
jgi:hypothetical protein